MPADPDRPFDLEGVVAALNVLRVRSTDLQAIATGLERKVRKTPALFRGAPVVIDLQALDARDAQLAAGADATAVSGARPFALAALLQVLRDKSLVPVGVYTPSAERLQEAAALGLGAIDIDHHGAARKPRPVANEPKAREPKAREPRPPEPSPPPPAAPDVALALTLMQPLRAGQVVYAEGRDAVALSAVHSGAELMADGNIHVYAPLRGRALAGASGREDARIFCQKLEADLISIAGVYLSSDALPADKRGKPVQVSLQNGELVLSEL